mgnify:CR=1 FL=1
MKLRDILNNEQLKALEEVGEITEANKTGLDAAKKIINHLRSKVYRSLSDDELDNFKIEMADHLGLELPSYLKRKK